MAKYIQGLAKYILYRLFEVLFWVLQLPHLGYNKYQLIVHEIILQISCFPKKQP